MQIEKHDKSYIVKLDEFLRNIFLQCGQWGQLSPVSYPDSLVRVI